MFEIPTAAPPKFAGAVVAKLAAKLTPPPAPASVNVNPVPACKILSFCNVSFAPTTTYEALPGAPKGSLAVAAPLDEYTLYDIVLSVVVNVSLAYIANVVPDKTSQKYALPFNSVIPTISVNVT